MPRSKTTDISPLIKAINANSTRDVAAAIAAGCDVNTTYLDMTPLMCAIHNGRPELVQLLLKHGTNPLQRDRSLCGSETRCGADHHAFVVLPIRNIAWSI